MQKRYPFAALAVLVSTVVTPIAVVRFSFMSSEYDTQLYFIWGRYSLRYQRIWFYGSGGNPFTTAGLENLAVFWIGCGIILSAIILSFSRISDRPFALLVVAVLVLLAQDELPFLLAFAAGFVAYSVDYVLILPIPSLLTIAALLVFYQMQKQSTSRQVDSE